MEGTYRLQIDIFRDLIFSEKVQISNQAHISWGAILVTQVDPLKAMHIANFVI
jgi:hypothetical protein